MNNQTYAVKPPAPRVTGKINKVGLWTLTRKEIERFLNVYLQTLIAPVITTMLFYAIFAMAFGGLKKDIGGVPYMEFLAPGLIMMSMVQNAFANSSSSIVIAKVQGNIVDVLMPPLSAMELLTGFITGGVVRGLLVGACTGLAMSFFVDFAFHSILLVIAFGIMGTVMMASIGLIAGIWAEKFDHIASVTNFVITPLAFLSGTFYSIHSLPDIWINIAHFNPFFYMIDGFRYAFSGYADSNPVLGLCTLVVINCILVLSSWQMLKSGYKIKS
jgi:ABC-2 type transport system permease protein